jgi:hypothetical protein
MHGLSVEFSLNFLENTFHPYVRYDYTNLPSEEQGPYYGLRRDGDSLTKHYIPEFNGIMVGANYDLSANVRIKLEYVFHLDGAREENAAVFQLAYGF